MAKTIEVRCIGNSAIHFDGLLLDPVKSPRITEKLIADNGATYTVVYREYQSTIDSVIIWCQ
jgi:hypothetical protein